MERDILVEILERAAHTRKSPGQDWAETVSQAVQALVAGLDGRWGPAAVMGLRADLARAERELDEWPVEARDAAPRAAVPWPAAPCRP